MTKKKTKKEIKAHKPAFLKVVSLLLIFFLAMSMYDYLMGNSDIAESVFAPFMEVATLVFLATWGLFFVVAVMILRYNKEN
jgi:uncharacterized membrane protein